MHANLNSAVRRQMMDPSACSHISIDDGFPDRRARSPGKGAAHFETVLFALGVPFSVQTLMSCNRGTADRRAVVVTLTSWRETSDRAKAAAAAKRDQILGSSAGV